MREVVWAARMNQKRTVQKQKDDKLCPKLRPLRQLQNKWSRETAKILFMLHV